MSVVGKWFGFGSDPKFDDGIRAFERGDFDTAIASLKSVRDPHLDSLARFYLGESFRRRSESRLLAHDFMSALDDVSSAIALHGSYADLHLLKARIHRAAGQTEQERTAIETAIEKNPEFAAAHVALGQWHLIHGDPELGWDAVDTALELRPRWRSANLESAKGQHPQQAAVALETLNDHEAAEANRLMAEGDRMAAQAHFDNAASLYQNALDLKPQYPDIRCRLGQVYLQLDRVEEALEAFDKALEVNPNYTEAHAQRGVALKRLGQATDARDSFRRAYELDPRHIIASQEFRVHSSR